MSNTTISQTELLTEAEYIPHEHQLWVDRLRKWLGDTATLNVLEAVQENTDAELYIALQDAMDEINEDFDPVTTWTITTVPSWNALKQGAVLQVLLMKGVLSARNMLTYQDSGGVTVQDYDKYGRYTNMFNILITKYMRAVTNMKRRYNVDQCYGSVESEYSWNVYGGGQIRGEF